MGDTSTSRGRQAVTPYLHVDQAEKAIDFYKRVFGAKEMIRLLSPDGVVLHCTLRLGDSRIILAEAGTMFQSPRSLGGCSVNMVVYVADCDAVVHDAVAHGASVLKEPADMFWGDRYGILRDPFGQIWQVATHKEDVTAEEMNRRAAVAFAG
ncbi:MAG: VOC family protein [Bryobacterales bacterium]|nr:VOC family protein [Bryobacterales bacterium]